MSDIGNRLREARESRDLTTAQVEQVTRIRRAYIEALEEGRYDALPGDVYVKGFLRNYAQFLGLNPDDFLDDYRSSTGGVSTGAPRILLDEPLSQDRARRRIAGSLFTILMIVILGIAGWYAYNYFYLGIHDIWPLNLITIVNTPAAPTKAVILPTLETPAATPTPEPTLAATAAEPTATATGEPTNAPTQTPRPTATRTHTPIASPTPTQVLQIQVDAQLLNECYVRVIVDGEQVLEKILQQGENQSWIAQERLEIRLGDASAVQVTVNGVTVPPLGQAGEIIDLEYTLDNLPTP